MKKCNFGIGHKTIRDACFRLKNRGYIDGFERKTGKYIRYYFLQNKNSLKAYTSKQIDEVEAYVLDELMNYSYALTARKLQAKYKQ